jgi:hypothetical protein
MSLNGRLISTQEIVLNVIRNSKFKSTELNQGDIAVWCAEAVDLIGVPYALSRTISCIDIDNHRGILPCDLINVVQVSALTSTGVQIPMRTANNTFHPLFLNNLTNSPVINPVEPVGYDSNGNPIFNFLNYDSAISKSLVDNLPYTFKDVTYDLNSNFIRTSFKDGAKVLMSYEAFPIDDKGFPMIPDNIKFRKAVEWYVRMMIDYNLWRTDKIKREIFDHSEREWMWYCGAATTSGLMPTVDGMSSWKNQLCKLLPNFNTHDSFYDTLGNQEFYNGSQPASRY